jgi:HEAT repeat protein
MGLLDAMFGGGTQVQLWLDNAQASPGAVVGGRVLLTGGKKPFRVTELAVKLFFVRVQTREGQSLPDIDAREVAKQVVAAGIDLPPGAQLPYTFRITVPNDLPPTAHNVSFKVMASADIPGIKDPSADAEVKIVEASKDGNRRLPLNEVLGRFPGLQSRDEEALCKALYDFFLACYSEAGELMEAEPIIGQHMMTGTVRVRREALKAWANLVDNRVQPHHLQALYTVANTPGLDEDTFKEVITAATKFAEEGALQLVQQLAQNPSADIRADVASNLRFNAAEKFNGKRELLVQLAQDQSPQGRKAAVGALSCFNDDQQLMYWVANITDNDPAPEVAAACVETLGFAHHHGMQDLTLAVYEKHTQNPNAEVRSAIARRLSNQPPAAMQRVWGIIQRLMVDQDEEVRRSVAFEFNNMYKMPQLLPLAQQMAQNDPSPAVRKDAIGAMSSLMQPQQAAQFYGHLMTQARTEDELWPVLNGLRTHSSHPDVKRVLTQLGQSQYPDLANAARDALS